MADVSRLLRIAELLNQGFVLTIGHLSADEEQDLLIVRDELRQIAKRHTPPPGR